MWIIFSSLPVPKVFGLDIAMDEGFGVVIFDARD